MNSNHQAGVFGSGWRTAAWALVLLKLWLVLGLVPRVPGFGPQDQTLYLGYAKSILEGEWLGPYSQMTLARGPMYSIFMAATFVLQVPLSLALAVGYAGACVLLVAAIRPVLPERGWRFALFAVLLFNPITYDAEEYLYVSRQTLLPVLTMVIVAALVALYARRTQPLGKLWPWAVTLGLALAAFWLTREEAIWLLPTVMLAGAWLGWDVWRGRGVDRQVRLGVMAGVPLLCWMMGVGFVSYLNWSHYGVFTTCELRHPAFRAGYGALLRVEPEKRIPYVGVTRATRAKIYTVSPAFAELRPYLEGDLGRSWAQAQATMPVAGIPPGEIGGGWFIWAVRDAVHLAGRARTGSEAMAYYRRLALEVNSACDRGLLPAGPRHKGFFPPLRWSQAGEIAASTRILLQHFFSFTGLKTTTDEPSAQDRQSIRLFSTLTRERLPLPEAGPDILKVRRVWDQRRVAVLEGIRRCYAALVPWTGAVAALTLMAATVLALARRRLPFMLVLGVGCIGSFLVLGAIQAVVSVNWEPSGGATTYWMGAYGLWLFCHVASGVALKEALGRAGQPAAAAG